MNILLVPIIFCLLLIVVFVNDIRTNSLIKKQKEREIKRDKDELTKLFIEISKFEYFHLSTLDKANKRSVFLDLLEIHKKLFAKGYCTSEILTDKNYMIGIIDVDHVFLGNTSGLPANTINNWLNIGTDYELQTIFEQYRDTLYKKLLEADKNLMTVYERL